MSIRKDKLHKLVDLVSDKDTKLVYDLISVVIEKNDEKEVEIENDVLIAWDENHA